MENEKEFLKKMENLQVPEVDPSGHAEKVKMTIMNAERSAALGIWLIVVPCYFLFCVFMYYFSHLRVHISWFAAMFKLMEGLEKTRYIDFLGPIILVLLPIVCIVINGLAITHVSIKRYEGKQRQFQIVIKPRLWNVVLILISLGILFAFIAYAMTENISIN